MRKILFIFLVCILFLTGCNLEKTEMAFSKTPFTMEGKYTPSKVFNTGEKVYFAVYNPKGFKTRLLKVQIIKKESEKSEFFGHEYFYNKTVELKSKNYYTDYITFNNVGFYIFQIFEYTDLNEPSILGIIKVE